MWLLPQSISSVYSQVRAASISVLPMPLEEWAMLAERSLMWKSKRTVMSFWRRAVKSYTWMQRLYGRTLNPFRQVDFEDWWISSLADSRARICPWPASEPVSTEKGAASGQSSPALLGRFDPGTYLL